MAHRQLHRDEGGVQVHEGVRRGASDPEVQGQRGEGAERHLRPHPQAAEGPPGGDVVLGREQGLLQEDEGRLLPLPRGV